MVIRLRKPCEHGQYDDHLFRIDRSIDPHRSWDRCLGGEFLADDALVITTPNKALLQRITASVWRIILDMVPSKESVTVAD